MDSFKWGKQFVTNISEIDTQHQGLVSLINEYGNATFWKSNLDENALKSIFKQLISIPKHILQQKNN